MGEIKSAFEKAMEKAEKVGKASPQELQRMDYLRRGNTLAAKYLKGEKDDLKAELGQYDSDLRGYLVEGMEETLLRNIVLPQNEYAMQTNKRAMKGILMFKREKRKVESVSSKIEVLINSYEQARQHTYTQLRRNLEGSLEGVRKSLEQQVGTKVKIDAEAQPRFQEEWRIALAELNSQYERVLAEHKREIKSIG
jgi:hypothetical protein